jgi:transcriptional regulator
MYVPKFNREDDPEILQRWMRESSFALVITSDEQRIPTATHMPVAYDRSRGPFGTLVSHMARANPQWRDFRGEREILVVFSGPHAYISPTWYQQAGSVPTWNYIAVHAYGVPRVIEEPKRLRSMLEELVATYEGGSAEAYRPDWGDARTDNLLGAIVGFELEITRLEGKSKMSQNKSLADRRGVAESLERSTSQMDQAVAAIMRDQLD